MTDVNIGTVKAKIEADTSSLQGGLKDAKSQLSDFAERLGDAGKAGLAMGVAFAASEIGIRKIGEAISGTVHFVVDAVTHLAEFGSHLDDLQQRTGISADALQKLSHAGSLVGVSLDQMTLAVAQMQRRMEDAPKNFERLGISLAQLKAMAPEQQLSAIAEAIQKLPTASQQTAAAMDLLGRSGATLLPLLKSNIAGAAQEAEHLGLVLDQETIKAADALDDSLATANQTWEAFKNQMAAVIIANPEVVQTVRDITEALGGMTRAVRDNKDFLSDYITVVAGIAKEFTAWGQSIGMTLNALKLLKTLSMTFVPGGGGAASGVASGLASLNGVPVSGLGAPVQMPGAKLGAPEAVLQSKYDQEAAKRAFADYEAGLKREIALQNVQAETYKAMVPLIAAITGMTNEEVQALTGGSVALKDILTDEESRVLLEKEQRELANAIADAYNMEVPLLAAILSLTEDQVRAMTGGAVPATEKAAKLTKDWKAALTGVALIAGALGANFSNVLNIIENIVLAFKNAKTGAEKFNAIAAGIGQLGGLMGGKAGSAIQGAAGGAMLGFQVGGPWGAAIGGIAGGLIGLFKSDPIKRAQKEIGRILGHGVSREFAEQVKKEAEATGKSLAEVAKHLDDQMRFQHDLDVQATRREGVGHAVEAVSKLFGPEGGFKITGAAKEQARIWTAVFWDDVAENGIIHAIDAFKKQFEALSAVSPELTAPLAHIFDVFAEGPARDAAEGAKALADTLAGLAHAGYLDVSMFADFGTSAVAAYNQAIAGGASTHDALVAIIPLLAAILRVHEQTGFAIDANTQALIDQAKASGIAFPIDPMLQVVDLLIEIAKKLGADIPESAKKAADAIANVGAAAGAASAAAGGVTGGAAPPTTGPPIPESPYPAQGGLGPAIMPHVGGGKGPLIQTHPGEGVVVVPKSRMKRGGFFGAASGVGAAGAWEGSISTGGGGGSTVGGEAAWTGAISAITTSVTEAVKATIAAQPPTSVTFAPQIAAPVTVDSRPLKDREELYAGAQEAVASGIRKATGVVYQSMVDQFGSKLGLR